MVGTRWFNRFREECESLSPHVRFKEIRLGFFRIYYKGFYIGECFKNMPPKGYDIEEEDVRLENKSFYEEYEDSVDTVRTIKNFVEGYYDLKKSFRIRMYMLRNDQEFYENSKNAYKQMYIK